MGGFENTYRAEPPKLILISVSWVWTPIKRKIRIKELLR